MLHKASAKGCSSETVSKSVLNPYGQAKNLTGNDVTGEQVLLLMSKPELHLDEIPALIKASSRTVQGQGSLRWPRGACSSVALSAGPPRGDILLGPALIIGPGEGKVRSFCIVFPVTLKMPSHPECRVRGAGSHCHKQRAAAC